jgi:hypothetical protein
MSRSVLYHRTHKDIAVEAALIGDLASRGEEPFTALSRLAAFHLKRPSPDADLRHTGVRAGKQVFPLSGDVPSILVLLLKRVDTLWATCRSVEDDLFVAAFVIYGVTAIHPFENANGRIAVDLARVLLMQRWGWSVPSFALDNDARHDLLDILAALDPLFGGTMEEHREQLEMLLSRIDNAEVSRLRLVPQLRAAVGFLAAHSMPEIVAALDGSDTLRVLRELR